MELIYMNPNYLTIIEERTHEANHKERYCETIKPPRNNAHNDNLSRKAKSRLYNAMGWLLYFTGNNNLKHKKYNENTKNIKSELYGSEMIIQKESNTYQKGTDFYCENKLKYKLGMITLTLPSMQIHSDNYIRQNMLHQFLDRLMRSGKITSYIWKAEKQKNGNIHFHIIVNKFVWHHRINTIWNKILKKEGYIERYKNNQLFKHEKGFTFDASIAKFADYKTQLRRYNKGMSEDWQNPNTTDIHAIKKVKNLKSYMVKYLMKDNIDDENASEEEQENLKIKCKLWACSRNLASLKNVCFYVQDVALDCMRKLWFDNQNKRVNNAYFNTFLLDIETIIKKGYFSLYQQFRTAIDIQIFKKKPQLALL